MMFHGIDVSTYLSETTLRMCKAIFCILTIVYIGSTLCGVRCVCYRLARQGAREGHHKLHSARTSDSRPFESSIITAAGNNVYGVGSFADALRQLPTLILGPRGCTGIPKYTEAYRKNEERQEGRKERTRWCVSMSRRNCQ
jgi:hypothetical protein